MSVQELVLFLPVGLTVFISLLLLPQNQLPYKL